jgi:hypothetical protein
MAQVLFFTALSPTVTYANWTLKKFLIEQFFVIFSQLKMSQANEKQGL